MEVEIFSFLNIDAWLVVMVNVKPRQFYSGNDRLCKRLGGTQIRSGPVRRISPPPGFDPRVVQPVASRLIFSAVRNMKYRAHSHKLPA